MFRAAHAQQILHLLCLQAFEGVEFNGVDGVSHYGDSFQAEGFDEYYYVSITEPSYGRMASFVLNKGARVVVRFTTTNKVANPMLIVNSTAATPITYRGAAIEPGVLAENHTYELVYNGTSYEIVGDLDTTYTEATTSKAGLMSAEDKAKVDSSAVVVFSAEEPTDLPPGGLWMQFE